MAVADELVTILGIKLAADAIANIGKFKAGLDTVVSKLNQLAVITTGAAVAAGLFIKGVSDEANELQKLSATSGLSTDSLQEWAYAAEQVGVNAKSVQNDLVSLNKTMSSPIPGQFNVNMAMLGVSVRNANGELKSSEEVLQSVGDRLSTMSHQQQLQWASKIGISDETVVLLRQGSEGIAKLREEAHTLGAIIPSKSLQVAAEFRKSIEKMRASLRSLSSQIAIAAMPALQRVVELFTAWTVANREWIQVHTESFMIALVSAFEKVWSVVRRLLDQFDPLIELFSDLTGGMTTTEHMTGLLQGALTGLLVVFAPFLAKLALLAAGFYAISTAVEDVMYWINGDESFIGAWVEYLLSQFPGIAAGLETIKNLFSGLFDVVMSAGPAVIERVVSAFTSLFKTVLSNVDEASGKIAEFVNGFTERFPAIVDAVKALADVLGTVLGAALDGIVAALKFLSDLATDVFGSLLNLLGKALDGINAGLSWLGFGGDDEEENKPVEDASKYAPVPSSGGAGVSSVAPALSSRAGTSVKNSSSSTNYSDNKTVNVNIATNDPAQAGQAVLKAMGENSYAVLTPGQYAPTVS